MTVDELLSELNKLSILEALELVRKLEKLWGVSSLRRISRLFTPLDNIEEEEQQKEFNVVLVDCGPQKIETIKIIRKLVPNCGLKEAKDLSEGYAGGVILRGTDGHTAMKAVDEFNRVGAVAKIL